MLGIEQRIGDDDEPAGAQLGEFCKDSVEVALGAGIEDGKLHGQGARRRLHGFGLVSGAGGGGIDERGKDRGRRHQFVQQFEPLRPQLHAQIGDTGEIAAGPGEARNKAKLHRIAGDKKTIGIVAVAVFAALTAGPFDAITATRARDKIGGQGRQPIVVAVRPAIFDGDVAALDIAGFAQALVERATIGCITGELAEQIQSPASAAAPAPQPATPQRHRAGIIGRGDLFDDLIGAGEERLGNRQPERLGSLEVDDQLECRWLLHRKIAGLFALEDAADIGAGLPVDLQ